jgi:Homeodomain-like domain
MVKYVVRLPPEEREQVLALVNTGQAAAVQRLHARILLKADVDASEHRWTDAEIADALDTSASTVHRQYRKLDGAQEAQLIAVACSAPPEGRVRWTLKSLADKLVALDIVATISPECVRATLKKMCSNRGDRSNG